MTGKFTQNVHSLGYAAGQSLHKLFLLTNTNDNDDKTLLFSVCSITDLTSNLQNYTLSNIINDISSTLSSISLQSSTTSSLQSLLQQILTLPNRYRIWWINLLHSDPLHVLVETLLIVMCIALVVLQRRADWRFNQERTNSAPTKEEEEELINEWKLKRKALGGKEGKRREGYRAIGVQPRLVRDTTTTNINSNSVGSVLVVEKIEGSKLYLSNESKVSFNFANTNDKDLPTSVLNFATLDYLSSSSSQTLRQVASQSLSHYGCGSCGPRGFYGTIDAHLEVEDAMSSYLNTEGAILYSDGASAGTSTVAAFAKRGDLLIVDEGVSESLLVGVTLSRANVRYFRHNDTKDLRRVLEKIRMQDVQYKRKPTDQRRFLIVEGLYRNWGTIAPLQEIVKLKEEYHYRLIVDDSHGIGTLGKNGKGSLEHANLKPMVHCEILTFSLENALGSVGGMTVGSEEVVDHQRLSGAGYCFSASAPPFLSKVCLASVRRLEGRLDEMMEGIVDEKKGECENDGEEKKKIKSVDEDDVEEKEVPKEEDEQLAYKLNKLKNVIDDMKVADLKVELKKRGLGVSGRKAELKERLNDYLASLSSSTDNTKKNPSSFSLPSSSSSSTVDELSGPPLLERLHENISNLYNTLTNSSHPHALKLRNRLVITSHPQSPILYLRLAEQEATGRTRAEQTSILDQISAHCLVEGEVAIVSTGGHVKKYLQLVPEPSLRLVANVSQTKEDVELLVKVLGESVESVLVHNVANFMME